MTVQVAGTAEVKRWLLGYGGEVEVLEPDGLRQEMAAEADRLKKIYGEKASADRLHSGGVESSHDC